MNRELVQITIAIRELPLRDDGLPLALFFSRDSKVNAKRPLGHIPHSGCAEKQGVLDAGDSDPSATVSSSYRASINSSGAGAGL
jgi:hypothetical protein